MTTTNKNKDEIINKFHLHEGDTGSVEVQVALLSDRISGLTKHFESHEKDHSSRRGLLKMVGKRRKLLGYLKDRNVERYKTLIGSLGIRK